MEILKFSENSSPNRSNNNKRKPGAMIVAGVLVAMMGMSTTLAGTITISGGRVEFGQGLVSTAACDEDGITITPTSSFTNTSGATSDTFTVASLKLAGIHGSCVGKLFTIKAYSSTAGDYNNNDVATPMALTSSGSGASADVVIKFRIPTSNSESSTAYSNWTSGAGFATVTFPAASSYSLNAGSVTLGGLAINAAVTRFTIESADYVAP